MFGSFRPIFSFRGPFGVPIEIDTSLIFLFLMVLGFAGAEQLVLGTAFACLLILSIFAHELAHAWGALVQGLPVERIVLHGGGGFCELGSDTTAREDELIIALGPMANLAIWASAGLLAGGVTEPTLAWALQTLSWLNLFLAAFNLMPVFPLDGGRLLHLGLLHLVGPRSAVRLVGAVGLFCALIWLPAMLFVWTLLGFILLFFPSIPLHWRMLRGDYDE